MFLGQKWQFFVTFFFFRPKKGVFPYVPGLFSGPRENKRFYTFLESRGLQEVNRLISPAERVISNTFIPYGLRKICIALHRSKMKTSWECMEKWKKKSWKLLTTARSFERKKSKKKNYPPCRPEVYFLRPRLDKEKIYKNWSLFHRAGQGGDFLLKKLKFLLNFSLEFDVGCRLIRGLGSIELSEAKLSWKWWVYVLSLLGWVGKEASFMV